MQNYKIIEQIGTGSYSTVFRGEDLRTGELVALKVMRFLYASSKKTQDIELTALQKFQSNPCIIKLKEYFLQSDTLVLVFELAGIDLVEYTQQFIQNQQRAFTTHQVRIVSYQVAMALAEMHKENYMHRDIKPENILVDPQTYSVKLVDFGLSKRWESQKNTVYIATRWYRAPEVILNLPYTKAVDVFALGAVMLEMYLGYGAFPGANSIDQLNKVFSVTGTPTKENWPEGIAVLEKKKIQFPFYPPADLRKHLPCLCQEGIDLLTQMIKCNPKQRISIKDVIQHPYYKRITDMLPQNVKNFIYQQIPAQPQKLEKILSCYLDVPSHKRDPTIIGKSPSKLIVQKSVSCIVDPNRKKQTEHQAKQKIKERKYTHDYTGISSDMYFAMVKRPAEMKPQHKILLPPYNKT